MCLLSILDSPVLHIVAETLVIVVGSLLLGILFGYLHWGEYKKKSIKLGKSLDNERDQMIQLKEKLDELETIRSHMQTEINSHISRQNAQSKTIFDHQQELFEKEKQINGLQHSIEELGSLIETYEQRLKVIEDELKPVIEVPPPLPKRESPVIPIRANYEHVSQLLGRQVIENDLTVISGIGARTASLLESRGIETWEELANVSIESLRQILEEAGGVYKTLDPASWPKQSRMAAQSEWRKLRVYQETLKTT